MNFWVFSPARKRPLHHADIVWKEEVGMSMETNGGCAAQICVPPCSFPQTYVPLPHENSTSVKLCQIPRYYALKLTGQCCDSIRPYTLYFSLSSFFLYSIFQLSSSMICDDRRRSTSIHANVCFNKSCTKYLICIKSLICSNWCKQCNRKIGLVQLSVVFTPTRNKRLRGW